MSFVILCDVMRCVMILLVLMCEELYIVSMSFFFALISDVGYDMSFLLDVCV